MQFRLRMICAALGWCLLIAGLFMLAYGAVTAVDSGRREHATAVWLFKCGAVCSLVGPMMAYLAKLRAKQ